MAKNFHRRILAENICEAIHNTRGGKAGIMFRVNGAAVPDQRTGKTRCHTPRGFRSSGR